MQPNNAFSLVMLILLISGVFSIITARPPPQSQPSSTSTSTDAYIVFTEQPDAGANLESFCLSILTPVLGSKKAAKESLGYMYKNVINGFWAYLTSMQASQLAKQPKVLEVRKDGIQYLQELYGGGGGRA